MSHFLVHKKVLGENVAASLRDTASISLVDIMSQSRYVVELPFMSVRCGALLPDQIREGLKMMAKIS